MSAWADANHRAWAANAAAYGLDSYSADAFSRAGAIIEANLRVIDPERALELMRWHLAQALKERAYERACAHVAIAANKLSVALGAGK